MIKLKTTAGPALSAAAMPVSEKIPAPMITPIPRLIRPIGPRVRLKVSAGAKASIGFLVNRELRGKPDIKLMDVRT